MKKYLPYVNYIAAGAGVLGALLRRWTLSGGADGRGLYPAGHPGWICYLALISAALIAIFLMTRKCGEASDWASNFPGGILPALGHVLAAGGIGLHSVSQLQSTGTLHFLSCWLGFFAAAALLVLAWQNFQKKPPMSMAYLLPCLYFGLQLFLLGRTFSTETQLLRFLPQLLAMGASALASYQFWGFAVGLGNREKSLFWSLSAACLCLSAAPDAHVMYALVGLWHLLSHCALTVAPIAPEQPPEAPEEKTEE